MRKRFIKSLPAICAAIMLMMSLTASDRTAFASAATDKNLDAGATWVVNETTNLNSLSIAKGAAVKTPEGYSLTMTVDGVETPIKPGAYRGKIVLTITREITVNYNGTPYKLRAAIDVEDGKYAADTSVAAAVAAGKVTDSSAKDVKITSVGENFNGIIIRGDSKSSYSIVNPAINLVGHGGNDFAGVGAAIMTDGNSDVTVSNASIITDGSIRTAAVVRGKSTIHVNDSNIEVHNGALPEDYSFSWTNPSGALMQVPWMLGLTGTCRATNLIENGTAYYNNTHIKAQGWGALSVDDTKKVRLNATKCLIETIDSGYGAYSIGDCVDTFSACKINVADMALIMANETASGVFTEGTVVNSGRFGVMVHAGNYGLLTIDKGSIFNTKKAVIQVKSSFPSIVVDNAKLNSQSGVILQAIVNDDPNMAGAGMGGGPGGDQAGASGAGGGMPGGAGGKGAAPSGGAGGGGMPGATPAGGGAPDAAGGGMPGGAGAKADTKTDINATFKNMTLNGDIINSMTTLGEVVVTLERSAITGAITTAAAEHAVGKNGEKLVMKNETDLYYLIGEVKNTYCTTPDKYGVKVSLDGNSTWVVDKTSYLTGLTIAKGANVSAPKGYSVTMTVNGVNKAIDAGDYKGKIVLTVTKG